MRLLLDTHAFIWHRDGNPLLSDASKAATADVGNEIFISSVSLWEIGIKVGLGKLKLAKPLNVLLPIYLESGAQLLSITPEHAMAIEHLPWHHRDPFDRMLIVQSQLEGLTLVTRDSVFGHYDVSRFW